jgi:catechol 2,3-dioxygenase-like lactoylglutathione lyase family enzyme
MRHLTMATVFVLASASLSAQAPAPAAPAGPAPTGLVGGSGNFFSPIVADLDKAVAFYRDGLGLDVQGAPANADANPALRNMFGLPDAQLRWTIGRPAGMRTGVEMVEIKKADGKLVERRLQDSGAFMLIALVRDIDATFNRLKALGAPVVTTGGAPIAVPAGSKARAVIVKDPDGHFVELYQPDPLPAATATPAPNVIEVRVRLAVGDVEKETKVYRDALGLAVRAPGEFRRDAAVLDMMGLPAGAEFRAAMFTVPTTGLTFELIDFKGVDRRTVRSNIQDPGSTRIQLQVKDVDATIAALKQAGSAVVSSGGTTVELPGRGGATTKVAIVRDPNNLFLVLLQTAAPAAPAAR